MSNMPKALVINCKSCGISLILASNQQTVSSRSGLYRYLKYQDKCPILKYKIKRRLVKSKTPHVLIEKEGGDT